MKIPCIVLLWMVIYFSGSLIAQGQTGISYFDLQDPMLPNAKIVGVSELEDGNILSIALSSDPKYLMHSVNFLKSTSHGEIKVQTSLDVSNLYDLSKLIKMNKDEVTLFGNTFLNNAYEPFQLNLNAQGAKTSSIQLPQVYSTLLSDAIYNDGNFLVLYSKVGKNELYNISLHKVNAATGNVVWLKKISSENNEEADKIVTSSDGNFYVLGKKYNDAVTEYIPIIYKIDKYGNQLWKKALDVPANFNKHSIHILKNDELLYVCGYTKSQTGFSETLVLKLSNTGENMESNNIGDFSANGLIQISAETFLLFGSKFQVDMQQVVTKGKFVIIDRSLDPLIVKTLDETDKPDVQLQTNIKTSSDFLCAQKLSDNKVALGGKVFMPVTSHNNERFNVPLLMIINNDGSYIK